MLKKYKTIIVVAIAVITAIAAFIFVREASPLVTAPESPPSKPIPVSTSPLRIKALINIKILSKSGGKTKIIVHWENLPEGTTALDIFRSLSRDSIGTLIKTLSIDENSLKTGDAIITFSGEQNSYFSAAAISNNGVTLWTSPLTEPTTALTEPTAASSSGRPATKELSSPLPSSPVSNLSPTPSGSQPSSSSNAAPNRYITYYTPQGEISGSSTPQVANFWVQHVDRKIQIGWQNIPSDTDRLIVSRSASTNGPWTALLTQKNPITAAPYSLQIVDNTLNDAYYYKLDVYHANTFTTTYGPLFLGPISQ